MSVFPPLARIGRALLALALLAGCGQQNDAPPDVPAIPPPTVDRDRTVATPSPTATPPALPTAVPLPTWTPIPTPVAGVLFVDAAQDRGPISPLVYGSGYGPWVSLRPQTIPLAQASGITVLRYPGRRLGRPERPPGLPHRPVCRGGPRNRGRRTLHPRALHGQHARLCRLGSSKYANVDKGYGVQYWSIGNEPSLYEAAGEGWTAAEFAAEWRKFAEAMKAVDPTILARRAGDPPVGRHPRRRSQGQHRRRLAAHLPPGQRRSGRYRVDPPLSLPQQRPAHLGRAGRAAAPTPPSGRQIVRRLRERRPHGNRPRPAHRHHGVQLPLVQLRGRRHDAGLAPQRRLAGRRARPADRQRRWTWRTSSCWSPGATRASAYSTATAAGRRTSSTSSTSGSATNWSTRPATTR